MIVSALSYAYVGLSVLLACSLLVEMLSRMGWPAPNSGKTYLRQWETQPDPDYEFFAAERNHLREIYLKKLIESPAFLEAELGAKELPVLGVDDLRTSACFLALRMLRGRRVDESPVHLRGPRVFASPIWEPGPRGYAVRRIVVGTTGSYNYLYGPNMLQDIVDEYFLQVLIAEAYLSFRTRPMEFLLCCVSTRNAFLKDFDLNPDVANPERLDKWPPFSLTYAPYVAHYGALSLLMADVCRRRAAGAREIDLRAAYGLIQNPELARQEERRLDLLESTEEEWEAMVDVHSFSQPIYDELVARFGREMALFLSVDLKDLSEPREPPTP